MEKLDAAPIARRVQIARALVEVTADAKQRAELTAMADELESIQHRHHQLLLNLKQGGKR